MKKILLLLLIFVSGHVLSQNGEKFYATMSLQHAETLAKQLPNEFEIISKNGNEAAVFMTANAGDLLHGKILVHGPGYIYKSTRDKAINSLQPLALNKNPELVELTITEDEWVNQALEVVTTQNIENHILELQAYGTRYHTKPTAVEAANDLKTKWEALAATYNRDDVSVRLVNHSNTGMPSVIMTITGASLPNEFIVVGGHLDSTAGSNNVAPGADDDASGIATITEATRSLFEINFVPKRTIEIMAYAAEEIGLVGSAEIAEEYNNTGVDVQTVVQFDMTNYNGSANDISFVSDFTNATLNSYLMSLLDHYNASGAHAITYGSSFCNYGCSDHASWTDEGFMASFPFEANFGDHNPNIHTTNDTFAVSGTAEHATKFTKLCVEYLIETAKSETILSVDDFDNTNVKFLMTNRSLHYDLSKVVQNFTTLAIYDIQGKMIYNNKLEIKKGTVSLANFQDGVYIAKLFTNKNQEFSKKFILK